MKYAICNELFEGWDIERVLAYAAKTGYQAVEIAPFTLADDAREITTARREQIRASARANGIEVIGLHWLLVKPAGMHINSADAAVRQKTEAYMEALIGLCSDLGGKILVFGSPKQRAVSPHEPWLDVYKRSVDVFSRLARKAASYGVTIAFEPLAARDNCNFINTMAEGSLLVEAVNSPGFKLHLDVKAMYAGDCRPVADYDSPGKRPQSGALPRQRSEPARTRHGRDGVYRLRPIADALKEVRYDGYVSVEVFDFTPGPEKTAEISLRTLKQAFGDK